MIRLNVFIKVEADKRAAVLEIATKLVVCSLKDKGCIAYDVFESSTRPDVLMICETWEDDDALTAHNNTEHFVELVPQLKQLSEMKTERFDFFLLAAFSTDIKM